MNELLYEVRRRWYSFRTGFKENAWYRYRLIGFFVVAMVIACDLVRSTAGRSVISMANGMILGIVCFISYEKSFRTLNVLFSTLRMFGLNSTDCYLLYPNLTIWLSCVIKLAWLRLEVHWIVWLLLIYEISNLWRYARIMKLAIELLTTHVYHADSAHFFLRHYKDSTRPAGRAFDILHDWVEETTGDDIDVSDAPSD